MDGPSLVESTLRRSIAPLPTTATIGHGFMLGDSQASEGEHGGGGREHGAKVGNDKAAWR